MKYLDSINDTAITDVKRVHDEEEHNCFKDSFQCVAEDEHYKQQLRWNEDQELLSRNAQY